MAASLQDDFNRADAATLGANWTADIANSGFQSIGIASNQAAYPGSGTAYQSNWWNVETFDADQEAYVTIVTIPVTNAIRIYCRLTNPGTTTYSGYELEVNSATAYISRVVDGARTTLLNTFETFAAGDEAMLRCEGSTLTAYRDSGAGFVSIGSTTDAFLTGSGYAGLWVHNDTTPVLDNFYAGPVAAASGGTARNMMLLGVG